jgi:hypothetical protein
LRIALTNCLVGEGRALYRTAVDADLEAIVAKRLADADRPKLAHRHKSPSSSHLLVVRDATRSFSRSPCPSAETLTLDF